MRFDLAASPFKERGRDLARVCLETGTYDRLTLVRTQLLQLISRPDLRSCHPTAVPSPAGPREQRRPIHNRQPWSVFVVLDGPVLGVAARLAHGARRTAGIVQHELALLASKAAIVAEAGSWSAFVHGVPAHGDGDGDTSRLSA